MIWKDVFHPLGTKMGCISGSMGQKPPGAAKKTQEKLL